MDIADPVSVERALARLQPWAVINTAGFVRVDDAEHDARQWRENAIGPHVLALACARHGVRLLGFSSDLVFDGASDRPYVERDSPQPLNAYGRAKREAELRVLAAAPNALMVRTAAFFSPWNPHNFVTQSIEALRRGDAWQAASDQWVSPTYVPDLVQAAIDLLVDGESGIWHLANEGVVSWSRLACMAAEALGLDTRLVQSLPSAALRQPAMRPRFCALSSERGQLMPSLEDGLARYLSHSAVAAAAQTAPQAAVL
jgi:dTDP-4-dehydrorhamnose reductase